jgi:hypothetical protein
VLLAVDTISSRKGHQGQQQMGTNYCLSPAARDVLADVSSSQKIEFNYYGYSKSSDSRSPSKWSFFMRFTPM